MGHVRGTGAQFKGPSVSGLCKYGENEGLCQSCGWAPLPLSWSWPWVLEKLHPLRQKAMLFGGAALGCSVKLCLPHPPLQPVAYSVTQTHTHTNIHTQHHTLIKQPHKQPPTHSQAFLHTQYTLTKTSTHSPTPHTQTHNTHTLQTHYHISTQNAQTPTKSCSHTHSSHADTCKYILTQKHKYYINPQTHTHKHWHTTSPSGVFSVNRKRGHHQIRGDPLVGMRSGAGQWETCWGAIQVCDQESAGGGPTSHRSHSVSFFFNDEIIWQWVGAVVTTSESWKKFPGIFLHMALFFTFFIEFFFPGKYYFLALLKSLLGLPSSPHG